MNSDKKKQKFSLKAPKVQPVTRETDDGSPMPRYLYPEEKIAEHLRPFYRMYRQLLRERWFEKTEKSIEEADISQEFKDYAKTLIQAMRFTNSLETQQEYFNALSTLLAYISGEIHLI